MPRKYSLVAKSVTVALASVVALSAESGAWAAAPGEGEIRNAGSAQSVAGDYIVVLKDNAAGVDSTVNALSGKFGGQVKHRYKAALRGYAVTGMTEQQAKRLAADPAVAYVQQDLVVKVADTIVNPAWHYDRLDQRSLPLNRSYTYPRLATDVHAYVIDTGINIFHSAWSGDGYQRASYGYNAVDPSVVPADCDGHGTFVAGLISGHGISTGVAKDVNLVAVKVLDCQGFGTISTVVAGLDWVTANAVRPAVANMSLSGLKNQVVDDAVRRTIAAGVTVTAAAGNGDAMGNPMDACLFSPASIPEAITVAATDVNDRRAFWSNTGTCVDMFAPGVDIISTSIGGGYEFMDGTSMSAPHVAGAAALILQLHPDYTPAQVHSVLVNGASLNVVADAGVNTPNRLLYVRNVEPPAIASNTVGLYNPRFGTTEVYARTAANHLTYSYWAGGWSEWVDLGGDIVGDPAVLYNPKFGSTEVYVRTASNTIAYRYYSNGWSDWLDLGGAFAGDPAVLYNPKYGTTEVYARTADNRLVYKYFSNGWSGWNDL
ncbi:S8 family serine peptidase, partial [Rhizocola hellebori]|uniref:S8 family serine peptidase n=1 Tax=Rhizocola hellebori TaxID=1392758 RepID=UPI001EF17422